jgi:DNA repair exonuclease SbcCD ATPase subunit
MGWFGFPNDKEEFSSGNAVPDQISNTLNINEINIQNQLDEHFLITSSPGEVARVFNKIVNIEKADEYISELTTLVNKENNKIQDLKDKKLDYEQRIDSLNYLEDLEAVVSRLESRTLILSEGRQLKEHLKNSIEQLKVLVEKDKILMNQISFLNGAVSQIEEKLSRSAALDIQAIKIEDFITSVNEWKELIVKKSILESWINHIEPKLKKYDQLTFLYADLEEQCLRWGMNRKELKTLDMDKLACNKKMKMIIDLYKKELEQVKTCPFCLSEINENVIDHLMEKVNAQYIN